MICQDIRRQWELAAMIAVIKVCEKKKCFLKASELSVVP
jgi:hypothetical protein